MNRPIWSASLASRSRSCMRRRGRLRTLACGDAAASAIAVQVARRFAAIAFHSQHQLQRLVGEDTRLVGQAAVLAEGGEALVERADGVSLFQQPRAEALEQPG